MSETTQILFNSPALHSLKRDQLVKLCKIHSLKASGKNVELVERLKTHALTLPPGDPLSLATRSEIPTESEVESDVDMQCPSSSFSGSNALRPSGQWDVVMDAIEETSEPSQSRHGSMSSMRSASGNTNADEFGSSTSKPANIGSSFKALLKRAASTKSGSSSSIMSPPAINDELTKHSTRYSRLPETNPEDMPLTDHFKLTTPDDSFTNEEPLPGGDSCPGLPVLADSRLSMGTSATPGPTTTIRLVSASPNPRMSMDMPQLKPFSTTFDFQLASPGKTGPVKVPVWPLSPGGEPTTRLYPTLPDEDLEMLHREGMTPIKPLPARARNSSAKKIRPTNDVQDLFSPAKKPSDNKPHAPAEPFRFGSPVPEQGVSNREFKSVAASVLEEANRRLSEMGGQPLTLEILDNKSKSNAETGINPRANIIGSVKDRFERVHEKQFSKMDSITTHYAARRPQVESKKRKSEALGRGEPPGKKRASTQVQANGALPRKKVVPGGFGDEDDEDDEERGPQTEENRRMSKRVRVEEGDGGVNKGRISIVAQTSAEEARKKQREQNAVRRALDMKKDKRRSSMRRISGVTPQTQKTKRFGFLSSAKSIVRSIWGTSKAAATPSKPAVRKPDPPRTQTEKAPNTKPSTLGVRPSIAPAPKPRTVSSSSAGSVSIHKPASKAKAEMSSTHFPSTSGRASVLTAKQMDSTEIKSIHKGRDSSNTRSNTLSPKESSLAAPPCGKANETEAARVASQSPATANSSTEAATGRIRTLSRLMAPTASSLAKTRGSLPSRNSTSPSKRTSALAQITNSPTQSPQKATPGKIFSKPLEPMGRTVIPSPAKPTSLGAAASTLASLKAPTARPSTVHKSKLPVARKPRVSRSRVIAKLGAQRAVGGGMGSPSAVKPRVGSPGTPRTRSSVGTAVRRSYAGGKTRGSDVLLSAKKRARQSENVRRRVTRVGGSAGGPGKSLFLGQGAQASTAAMDVDA